ncbi:MAG: GNAT family N-acetyltransferase [Vibrio sp.]
MSTQVNSSNINSYLNNVLLTKDDLPINQSEPQIVGIPAEAWPQIEEIQEIAYRDGLAENIDILKIKADVSPETCFVCMDDEQQVLGYVLAHPWESEEPPHINQDISDREEVVTPQEASTLYIHDLAISPKARGAGVAQALIDNLFEHAQKWDIENVSLVAVQGMSGFWSKFGFKSIQSNHTDSYGDDAQLMVNQL